MKFSNKEDIEAPIDTVFEMLSTFDIFERSAIRRGVEVQRIDTLAEPGVGAEWSARFAMRGKVRELNMKLVEFDRPNRMRFDSKTGGIEGMTTLDLVALSPRRTRMALQVEIRPKTLAARIFVQSLKLAKGNLDKRFKTRSASYAKELEDRARALG